MVDLTDLPGRKGEIIMNRNWKLVGKVMFDGENKKHYLLTNKKTKYKTLYDTKTIDFEKALSLIHSLNYSIYVNV